MSAKAAFNFMLTLTARTGTVTRPGDTPVTIEIKYAASNYSRNLEGPANVVIPGKEFVISYDSFSGTSYPLPLKRGDRMVDPELGTMVISEVREMFDLGGGIMGYRVRIS